jgi:two-component system cell cycle sensor histidine kinase/response regulator CckA
MASDTIPVMAPDAGDERGILHDLGNAVAGAMRLVESALGKTETGHAAREDLLALAAALGQAAELVREAVEGAPPPGGSAELNAVAAGQVEVARRTHGVLARLMPHREPVRVRIGPADLRRVLDNLLLNAVEAVRGTDREISVRIGRGPGERALLEIRDAGRGMDAPTLARIFEPGFTTRPGIGKGLGLKVVRDLVERHGGDIRVTSTPGLGTSVRVLLPVAPRERGAGTILLVDDQADVRASMKSVLQDSGYRVLEAGDAKAALRLLDAGVDLLLTDLKLPDMDGNELAKAATVARPGLKVALMSGYAWRDAGSDILVKPADPDELRERVGAILRG